jgi:hypothetical protein
MFCMVMGARAIERKSLNLQRRQIHAQRIAVSAGHAVANLKLTFHLDHSAGG